MKMISLSWDTNNIGATVSQEEFVLRSGWNCPHCNSQNTGMDDSSFAKHDQEYVMHMLCYDCGWWWDTVYVLQKYKNLRPGKFAKDA